MASADSNDQNRGQGGDPGFMPAPARIAVLAALCLAALGVAWRSRHLRLPGAGAVTARVEEASRLANQPLRAQEERAMGDDPVSMALWRIHQRRMAERLTGLTGGLPNTRTERLDPYGLRVLVALGVATAFAYSFGPGGGRISDAMTPLEGTVLAAARVDAWVTPPGYTGRAPVFLTGAQESGPLSVPAGSVLSVRVSDGNGVDMSFRGADAAEADIVPRAVDAPTDGEAASPASTVGAAEYELTLDRSGAVAVETRFRTLGSWRFEVVPDAVPIIAFDGEPRSARNGALEIGFTVEDDYGAPQGQAEIQVLQPTHKSGSTNTIPSLARFCMAPVGQAATHQGFSQ